MDTDNNITIDSQSVGEIAAALAKAQANIKNPEKKAYNPYFKSKYADGAAIREAITKELTDNDIAVIQPTGFVEGKLCIITTLIHKSGQTLTGAYPLGYDGDNPQKQGSAMTYARRYSLQAMVNVWADEEDDGQSASEDPDLTATADVIIAGVKDKDGSVIREAWEELTAVEKGFIWKAKTKGGYFTQDEKEYIRQAVK